MLEDLKYFQVGGIYTQLLRLCLLFTLLFFPILYFVGVR